MKHHLQLYKWLEAVGLEKYHADFVVHNFHSVDDVLNAVEDEVIKEIALQGDDSVRLQVAVAQLRAEPNLLSSARGVQTRFSVLWWMIKVMCKCAVMLFSLFSLCPYLLLGFCFTNKGGSGNSYIRSDTHVLILCMLLCGQI